MSGSGKKAYCSQSSSDQCTGSTAIVSEAVASRYVWFVIVHRKRVVADAVACEEVKGRPRHPPVRRPIAAGLGTKVAKSFQAHLQVPALLRLGHTRQHTMRVAVQGNLVSGLKDLLYSPRPALGRDTRNEEGGLDLACGEELENPGNAHTQPVGLVRHG